MIIAENGIIELNEDDPVMGLRPVADYCFSSLANWFGPAVVAAVFTGMGNDGFEGLSRCSCWRRHRADAIASKLCRLWECLGL